MRHGGIIDNLEQLIKSTIDIDNKLINELQKSTITVRTVGQIPTWESQSIAEANPGFKAGRLLTVISIGRN